MATYIKAILKEENPNGNAEVLSEKIVYSKEGREIGLGLGILSDGGNTLYMKSGDSMRQSSMLCYNREKDWGIIILLNQRNHPLR